MLAQISFLSALLASLGFSTPDNTAQAVDCFSAPKTPAPHNSHWYYRVDRTHRRKCWYLGSTKELEPRVAHSAREAPPAKPLRTSPRAVTLSLADFKNFMAHHGGTN